MKVIDILNEGAAAEASERVLKSILGHATWSAAQKIAFKECVDLCADAIEKMLLKGQDTTTAAATKEAWFAIQPRLQGTPWATRDFVQEIFTVAKAEAEDRVAKKAGTFKPKEAPKPTEAEIKTTKVAKQATVAKHVDTVMGLGLSGYLSYDVVYKSFGEYLNNQAWAIEEVKAKRLSVEDAKKYDRQQKMQLILQIAAAMPVTTAKAAIGLIMLPFKIAGKLPVLNVFVKWYDKTKKEVDLIPTKAEDPRTTALASAARSAAWVAWLALINSDDTIDITKDWNLYDSQGNPSGKVGRALTFKEMIAYWATNYSFGKDTTMTALNAVNAAWNMLTPQLMNFTTQQQDIEKAGGKVVTPNEVAKPPKKEKIGNTTWHGDWED
jgi:hypothetical protein